MPRCSSCATGARAALCVCVACARVQRALLLSAHVARQREHACVCDTHTRTYSTQHTQNTHTQHTRPSRAAQLAPTHAHHTIRWASAGAFYPFSRNHYTYMARHHEYYRWPDVAAAAKKVYGLRYRLLTYLYRSLWLAHKRGGPVAKPLLFTDPADAKARWGCGGVFPGGRGTRGAGMRPAARAGVNRPRLMGGPGAAAPQAPAAGRPDACA
jgi:hypothetical protein